MYEFEIKINSNLAANAETKSDINIWHRRLGHLNHNDVQKLVTKNMVESLPDLVKREIKVCEPCIFGKQSKKPYPKTNGIRSTRVLELIHSDVCGPIKPISWNKKGTY